MHTLNPACMHRPRTLHPGSAHTPSCLGLWSVVSWPCWRPGRWCRSASQAVSQRIPGRVACCATHAVSLRPPRSLLRISQLPTQYRGTSPGCVTFVSQHNPAAKLRACHNMPIRIATQSLSSQALARALLALARGSAMSQAMLAVPWCAAGRIVAPAACPCLLCHNTIPLYRDDCIVAQLETGQ